MSHLSKNGEPSSKKRKLSSGSALIKPENASEARSIVSDEDISTLSSLLLTPHLVDESPTDNQRAEVENRGETTHANPLATTPTPVAIKPSTLMALLEGNDSAEQSMRAVLKALAQGILGRLPVTKKINEMERRKTASDGKIATLNNKRKEWHPEIRKHRQEYKRLDDAVLACSIEYEKLKEQRDNKQGIIEKWRIKHRKNVQDVLELRETLKAVDLELGKAIHQQQLLAKGDNSILRLYTNAVEKEIVRQKT